MPSRPKSSGSQHKSTVKKGSSGSASRCGSGRYAAVYPPDITTVEKADKPSELFALYLSTATGRYAGYSAWNVWRDCRKSAETYILYKGPPAAYNDVLYNDATEIKEENLYQTALGFDFFVDGDDAEWTRREKKFRRFKPK